MTLHDERGTQLPDVFDIVRGEVVPGIPTGALHAVVEGRVQRLLIALEDRGLGLSMVGEVGIVIEQEPLTCRGADAAFLLTNQLPYRQSREGYLLTPPAIVVEVVSPNDRAGHLESKVQEYLSAGVGVVWVVYPESRSVRVHLPDGSERRLKGHEPLWCADLVAVDIPTSFLFKSLEPVPPPTQPEP